MSGKENTSLTFRLPYWSVGLLLTILIGAVSFGLDKFQVMGDTLHDYDTLARVAYLREAMQKHTLGHGFFERINAPYGMVLHWTLPFNALMLGLNKLFAVFKVEDPMHYAAYWAGPILRALVGPAAYWAGRQFLTPFAAFLASLLVAFSPFLLVYSHAGTANHHSLMFLETVLMCGLACRLVVKPMSNMRLPLATGAMAALCLWTTFELVIVAAPVLAVVFFLWVQQGQPRLRQLLLTTGAFSIATSIALLLDTPYGGLGAPVLDHISLAFQTVAAVPFAIALGAMLVKPEGELRRAGWVFLTGLAAGVIWLACYPFALHGVEGAMDPYVVREWLDQIEEVRPIYEWRKVALFLGPGLIAAGMVFPWRVPRERKEWVLMPLLGLYLLGQLHFRFALYTAVAGPYFLAYAYESIVRGNGEFPNEYNNLAKPAATVMVALFIGFQLCTIVFHYDVLSEPSKGEDIPDRVTCNPHLVRGPLTDVDWLGVGRKDPIIMNEINQAGSLLYWTDVRTVAGNYHRDSAGLKDNYLFFRDMGDAQAKEIIKKRGVDFVLLCGNGNDTLYSFDSVATGAVELSKPGEEFEPQETMYTRLSDQQPPPWLKLRDWPDDVDTDLLLYQVDKSQLK